MAELAVHPQGEGIRADPTPMLPDGFESPLQIACRGHEGSKVDNSNFYHTIVAMTLRRRPNPLVHRMMVRLPDGLMRALEKAAAEDRRRLSDFVRIALEDYLAARKKKRR